MFFKNCDCENWGNELNQNEIKFTLGDFFYFCPWCGNRLSCDKKAKYQSPLICSHSVKDDNKLYDDGYTFLGILEKDHIIKQEIHIWGKNE